MTTLNAIIGFAVWPLPLIAWVLLAIVYIRLLKYAGEEE